MKLFVCPCLSLLINVSVRSILLVLVSGDISFDSQWFFLNWLSGISFDRGIKMLSTVKQCYSNLVCENCYILNYSNGLCYEEWLKLASLNEIWQRIENNLWILDINACTSANFIKAVISHVWRGIEFHWIHWNTNKMSSQSTKCYRIIYNLTNQSPT